VSQTNFRAAPLTGSESETSTERNGYTTARMIDCYRDDSVMQYACVAVSDGFQAASRGDFPASRAYGR
jgi:hypothetical protein